MKEKQRQNFALVIISFIGLCAIGAMLAMLGPVSHTFESDTLTGAATASTELKVTPNPCRIVDGDFCPALVKWKVPEATYSQVWVSMNGGREQYFGCSDSEDAELAPWIGKERFDFKLYPATSCKKEDRILEPLAHVVATGAE